MGFSLINHPFWGIPIYGTPHINLYTQGMTGMTMFGADFRDESSKSHILSILWAVLTSSGPGPTSTSAYSCGAAVVSLKLPSGYVKIAIENGHWNSGFTHWTWWFSIVFLYVYQAGYATWNRLRQSHVPWLWLVFCRRCYAATADADFGGFHTLLAGSRLNSMTFPVKPPFSGDFPWVFPTWWLIPLSKWIITPVIYMG